MRLSTAATCLALMAAVLGAPGCSALGGSEAGGPEQQTTTLAPSTTTTLSQAQVTLGAMTTRQKTAQVLLPAFSGTSLGAETSALLAAGPPGGLLLHASNFTDAAQMQDLTAALQQAAAAAGSPVGLLIAVDQEGGRVQRITEGVPALPSPRELGTESTPDHAAELARQTARGLLDMGVNMNLVPVADVVADKTSFLYERSYGSDPVLVSDFVTAVIQASQGQGLICVVKHFPGHGSAAADTHYASALSQLDRQELEAVHLPPFRAAISTGVEGVMISHVKVVAYDSADASSFSAPVIGGLLRGDLGFQGLVMADDLFMMADQKIKAEDSGKEPKLVRGPSAAAAARIPIEVDLAVKALNAGCDLLILSEAETNSSAVLEALVTAIDKGMVSQARLDEAVLKILDLKYRYGLIVQSPLVTTTQRP